MNYIHRKGAKALRKRKEMQSFSFATPLRLGVFAVDFGVSHV